MRFLSYLAGGLMLATSGMALAEDPARLDAAAMDSVTAGLWSGGSIAFTANSFALGNSVNFFELSQSRTNSSSSTSGGSTTASFTTAGSAQQQIQSRGVGATAAGGSGGVFSGVFANTSTPN